MRYRVLRASTINPAGGGTMAHRVVLARRAGPIEPLVVWTEVFSRYGTPVSRFTGDYYSASEVDAAHARFQVRRDRDGLGEELDPDLLVPGISLPTGVVAAATAREAGPEPLAAR